MKSFSSEIDDEKQSTSVPEFDSAKQISREDRLKLQIGLIRDSQERSRLEDALSFAREHSRLLEERLVRAEAEYVDRHMRPSPELSLNPGGDDRGYEDRVKELRADYARTPEALALLRDTDARQAEVWGALTRNADQALQDQERGELSKEQFTRSRQPQSLQKSYDRALRR